MIKDFRIQNYQSHADTEIELSPTVTIFTGESDQGKTAIIRAFRKIVRNIPTGDFFIRYDQKECIITMTVDDKIIVRKVGKKNSVNLYKIDDEEYNNFGVGIPEEVKQELKISDIQTFEKEKIDLNIRTQHEGLFLVGGVGVEALRGRIFGKVTGSDVINRAVTNLNSIVRTQNKERDLLTSKISILDTSISSLVYLKELNLILVDVKQIFVGIDDLELFVQKLNVFQDEIRTILKSKTIIQNSLTVLESIDLGDVTSKLNFLDKLLSLKQQLSDTYIKLKSFDGIETLIDDSFNLSHEESLVVALSNLRQMQDQLNIIYNQKQQVEVELQELSNLVVTAEGDLESYKQELGTCPICEKKFDEQHLEKETC